jgi:gluconate 5-dehydrogenase
MAERTVAELFNLKGRTALVTGGCGHLGSSLCRALAEAGANVIVTSRDRARAAAFAASLPVASGATHHGIALDHTDAADIERCFVEAISLGEPIDILVNNGHDPSAKDWTTVDAEAFTRQLANATAYFLLARHLRDHLVARQSPGSIIQLGSMYGLVGSYPDAYEGVSVASPVAYQTLKGGIVQMTRHHAVYWARDNVRVNCLSPGPFPSSHAPPELVERLSHRSPMGRMGAPEELKGAVVFLASDASSYMTGQNLVIDGGWTAW